MADVTYIPDGMGQGNNLLPWLLAGNNGFGGLGGFNSIVDIFGLAIKDEMDDPDGYDGMAFSRYLADCNAKGVPIVWEDMI